MAERLALGLLLGALAVLGLVLVTDSDDAPENPPPEEKVHFMKKFVAALSGEPDNLFPAPAYEPLLKAGESIACADCHDPETFDLEAMLAADPGARAVESMRRDRDVMIPLMEAWVKRLNEDHGAKLERPVTCTDCHAWDPRGDKGERVLPALMASFVEALREPPQNRDPASNWRPLLKDPQNASMLCARCHGADGEAMEQDLDRIVDPEAAAAYAGDKRFMTHLMERWVTRLNRELRSELRKAVVCIDCHERDPRR